MGGFLDRATLNELLDELARALERKRVRGHVYLVGGAAMMLAFSRERSTHDADARIESGHGAVIEAARAIGRKHGIGESWLNEQATHYMPRARDERARTLYDSPYLVVTGASAEHMLAMKLEAGRDTDQEDVAKLVEDAGDHDARARTCNTRKDLPRFEPAGTGRNAVGSSGTAGTAASG